MTNNDSGFQLKGSGPEAYERYMVPIHCLTRAQNLIDSVSLKSGERVLDTACGTGIVSRYAAQRVGTLGHVTGIDLNPAMLEVAEKVSTYFDQIEYIEGNVLELPISDAQFDVVFCQQAIMFIPNREEAVKEMHRALKPGGRVGLNVFRTPEFNPAFRHLITALDKHAGAEAANFMRSPFIMQSVEEMRTLFEQAGFDNIHVVHRIETLRYPSVARLVRYETLNIPDPKIHEEAMQEALTEEMTDLVAGCIDDEGVVFPAQDFVVTAAKQ